MSDQHRTDVASKPVWFADFTIRTKLMGNALVPLLLVGGFAFWLQWQLSSVQHQVRVAASDNTEFALRAKDMQAEVIQVQQFLQDISATRGQDGLDDGLKLAAENREAFLANLARFRKHLEASQDTARLKELESIRQRFEAYYAAGVVMAKAYVDGGPAEGNKHMSAFDKVCDELQDSLKPFVDAQIALLNDTMGEVDHKSYLLRMLALGMCVVLGAMMALSNWVIYRSVVHPIQVAANVALRISRGDLRHQFMPKGQDEISSLLTSLAAMQDELRALVTKVRQGVEEVNATSGSISAANSDLSERTERQAAALEQTAASMHQLGSTVHQNAENAGNANDKALRASEVAATGGAIVAEVVDTMKGIHSSSTKVSEIIGVINGIAFQTNLLALNAAVEAARAGENGRGFAVVANEVRLLAGRSAEAAREIKVLIDSSQEQVTRGSALVDKAGVTMKDVVTAIDQVTQLVGEISSATREQSAGLSQVVDAVSHMDEATQQNAALVEQTAATADELKAKARDLVDAIHVFALDEPTAR